MSQYFDFKEALYEFKNDQNDIQFEATLPNFNYFNYRHNKDGTLLHCSVFWNYNCYCQILIENKFYCNKYNLFLNDYKNTPLTIAKNTKNDAFLIGLMQV